MKGNYSQYQQMMKVVLIQKVYEKAINQCIKDNLI